MNSNPSKRALKLSYFTVMYNLIEGLVSVSAGSLTGSISLVGFGLDSFIESLSSFIIIWRFKTNNDVSTSDHDELEQKAIRLIAYTFFILGTYVLFEALKRLYYHQPPEQNIVGIIIALLSIVIMTKLYREKKKLGIDNHIRSLVADSKQTLACIYMSFTLLFGLGLYYFFGLWWADAISAIGIAGFLFREGYNTYKEKKLCSC